MCDEHQEGLVRGLEINVAGKGGSSRWKMGLLTWDGSSLSCQRVRKWGEE